MNYEKRAKEWLKDCGLLSAFNNVNEKKVLLAFAKSLDEDTPKAVLPEELAYNRTNAETVETINSLIAYLKAQNRTKP
jgi:hypothetical protein